MPMPSDDIQLCRLDLRLPATNRLVRAFLADASLTLDEDVSLFVGLFDADDRLLGCGGLDGNVMKCLALSEEARGSGASARLISHLMSAAFDQGQTNVRVFTKPEYKDLFRSLGFSLCGEGSRAVLMESDGRELRKYCRYLSEHRADGVVIVHADPLTRGHLHLIAQAAAQCRRLAVIPVGQHKTSAFPYADRTAMLRAATSHLDNVDLLEGSDYAVSQLSFPSYFLKAAGDVSEQQAAIDLDIFCRHLAPSLGCLRRFVGTEPTDELTAQYNNVMQRLLPEHGIEVVEVERLTDSAGPISASRVRRALQEGKLREALPLVPTTDTPWLLAYLAVRALRKELALSPKPGLVDRFDSGSHTDMDFALMTRSIDSLHDFFTRTAVLGFNEESLTAESLRSLGIQAEAAMMAATGGVNTHRGAIFSLGLAVAAAARLLSGRSSSTLSGEIAALASQFKPAGGTHGQAVHHRYGTMGALENAQTGYAQLFRSWLPFYQNSQKTDADCLRLLMRIIAELDDSNAIYRAGLPAANEARRKAAQLADGDCSREALERLNEDFKRQHISHGGAADMLALTFFADSISLTPNTLNY